MMLSRPNFGLIKWFLYKTQTLFTVIRHTLLFSLLFSTITPCIMAQAQSEISITVNGQSKNITLADTKAARELKSRLESSAVTVSMSDYGGFEKVGALPWNLPAENRQITTTPGDVMLYQGNNIVIFYGTNSWSYTPLGKIVGASATEIRNFLSGGTIEATLSSGTSGLTDATPDGDDAVTVYTLQGVRVELNGRSLPQLPHGVYIINGKKQIIK
ncbi:MAG: hypothetical protein K2L99_02850 [Muribaculaceae bacterium]|nr:hypothetical protein [Muribaculaceae bacterium]